jgi:hypothetical protein
MPEFNGHSCSQQYFHQIPLQFGQDQTVSNQQMEITEPAYVTLEKFSLPCQGSCMNVKCGLVYSSWMNKKQIIWYLRFSQQGRLVLWSSVPWQVAPSTSQEKHCFHLPGVSRRRQYAHPKHGHIPTHHITKFISTGPRSKSWIISKYYYPNFCMSKPIKIIRTPPLASIWTRPLTRM